jgi:hypothetical protein
MYQCGYENPEEAVDEILAEVDETNVSRTMLMRIGIVSTIGGLHITVDKGC